MAAFGSSTKLPTATPFRCRVLIWPITPEAAVKFIMLWVLQITTSQSIQLLSTLYFEILDVFICLGSPSNSDSLSEGSRKTHLIVCSSVKFFMPTPSNSVPLLTNKHCWYRWKYTHPSADSAFIWRNNSSNVMNNWRQQRANTLFVLFFCLGLRTQ